MLPLLLLRLVHNVQQQAVVHHPKVSALLLSRETNVSLSSTAAVVRMRFPFLARKYKNNDFSACIVFTMHIYIYHTSSDITDRPSNRSEPTNRSERLLQTRSSGGCGVRVVANAAAQQWGQQNDRAFSCHTLQTDRQVVQLLAVPQTFS